MRHAHDLPHVDLREPDSIARVVARLTTHGVTRFSHGTGRDGLLGVARSLVTIRAHRDSDSDGVTAVARRPAPVDGTSLTGFTGGVLRPHTDGSAVDLPPGVLILACVRPARTGGRSHLVDGREIYDEIARTDLAMLAALSAPGSARFGGESGHLGAVFQQTAEGRITVRLRFDGLVHFSPGVAPYVDGLRSLVRDRTRVVDLRRGDGYILLNNRWLHGRTAFRGRRVVLRVVGDPLPHLDLPGGFRSAQACAQPATSAGVARDA